MSALLLLFIATFVLALGGVCALVVIRMLGRMQVSDNPRWPHGQARSHRNHGVAGHSRHTV